MLSMQQDHSTLSMFFDTSAPSSSCLCAGAWQKSQEPFMSFIASGAEPAEYGMMAVASSPNLELGETLQGASR